MAHPQTVDKPKQNKSDSHGESARGDGNPLSRYNLCKNGNFFESSHFCRSNCRHFVDSLKDVPYGTSFFHSAAFVFALSLLPAAALPFPDRFLDVLTHGGQHLVRQLILPAPEQPEERDGQHDRRDQNK